MAKKADESLKVNQGTYTIERVAKGSTYHSQKRAAEKWEQKNPQDKILFRVPQGAKEIITEYVEQKALENPGDPKYSTHNGKSPRPSVTAFIKSLIEEEMGAKLEDLINSDSLKE